MLYICTKICEIILKGIKVIERTRFLYGKLQRGKIPQKNVGVVTIFNLCMLYGHALYFYRILLNYLEQYQIYRADTISKWKITKGNNYTTIVGGVIVVYLCTSSAHVNKILPSFVKLS